MPSGARACWCLSGSGASIGRRHSGRAEAPAGAALKDVLEVVDEVPLVDAAAAGPRGLDGRALPGAARRVLSGSCCRPRACGRAGPSRASSDRRGRREVRRPGDRRPARGAAAALDAGAAPRPRPRGPPGALRREGRSCVDQDLGAPGFRHVRVAVLVAGATASRGARRRPRCWRGCARPADARASPTSCATGRRCAGRWTAWRESGARPRSRRSATCAAPEVMAGGDDRGPFATSDQTRRACWSRSRRVSEGSSGRSCSHGVTGSGKTEVYFRAAERCAGGGAAARCSWCPRSRSRRCWCARRRRASATTVSVLHSGLSAGERHDQWWRIREGEARGRDRRALRGVRAAAATSASWSWTRSTRRRTSRRRARATTRATWR